MHRPDDWKNPHTKVYEGLKPMLNAGELCQCLAIEGQKEYLAYEAGADAMLEGLIKGRICFIDKGGFYHDIKPDKAGSLVFITDDTIEEG